MAISKEKQEMIADLLTKKKAVLPCPRCGNKHFMVVEGYIVHPIQDNAHVINVGGKGIPCVSTVCSQCGYLSQHAAMLLGLSLEEGDEK